MTQTDSGLSVTQVAISTHNAYRWAGGQRGYAPDAAPEPKFDGLSEELQNAWLNVAVKGIVNLESHEGKAVPEVAGIIYRWFQQGHGKPGDDYDAQELKDRIAWEAATRHLNTLIDGDDLELSSQEEMWKEWAERRLAQQ